jgi:hypothetical protein
VTLDASEALGRFFQSQIQVVIGHGRSSGKAGRFYILAIANQ